jgi:hypothetical protein
MVQASVFESLTDGKMYVVITDPDSFSFDAFVLTAKAARRLSKELTAAADEAVRLYTEAREAKKAELTELIAQLQKELAELA